LFLRFPASQKYGKYEWGSEDKSDRNSEEQWRGQSAGVSVRPTIWGI
jgi:hypothetical protein